MKLVRAGTYWQSITFMQGQDNFAEQLKFCVKLKFLFDKNQNLFLSDFAGVHCSASVCLKLDSCIVCESKTIICFTDFQGQFE